MTDLTSAISLAQSEIRFYDSPTLTAVYNPTLQEFRVGYGFGSFAISAGQTITPQYAEAELRTALTAMSAQLDAITGFGALGQTQQASILHSAYAAGGVSTLLSKAPTLSAAITAGDAPAIGAAVTSGLTAAGVDSQRASLLGTAATTDTQGDAIPASDEPVVVEAGSDGRGLDQVTNPSLGAISESASLLGIPPPVDATASEAVQALWTNRVPMHEPWPRVLKGSPMKDPDAKQDYDDPKDMTYEGVDPPERQNVNRHHDNEFSDDSAWVGRAEGNEKIERGKLWRR
jgi:hypothetical protein